MNSKLKITLALAAVLAVTASVGLATGAIPSTNDGTINTCIASFNGTKYLRPIDKQAGEKCKTGEKPLTWNQKGVAGPAGSGLGRIERRVGDESTAPGATNQIDAFCKPGERAISGGWFTDSDGANVRLTASFLRSDGAGWSIEVVNQSSTTQDVIAQAYCVA
jgi:hypothetical protein